MSDDKCKSIEAKVNSVEAHLEESGLESSEGHTNFEVQLLASINRQRLIPIWLTKLVLQLIKPALLR